MELYIVDSRVRRRANSILVGVLMRFTWFLYYGCMYEYGILWWKVKGARLPCDFFFSLSLSMELARSSRCCKVSDAVRILELVSDGRTI